MKVLKFGGSSVKDALAIKRVKDIVLELCPEPSVLVFSAMKGITDSLITAAEMAEKGNLAYEEQVTGIWNRQLTAIDQLFDPEDKISKDQIVNTLQVLINELNEVLHGAFLVKECSPRNMDFIMSFGERLNNNLIASFFNSSGQKARYIDARKLIRTDQSHGAAEVDFAISYRQIEEALSDLDSYAIVTGFIASDEKGITTTLGRNGSDYTASIFGAALRVDAIEIWTDVDGVLSADPRIVEDAFVIPEISVEEAMELSYFGAEVIHPYTMIPAIDNNIPIWIKNTLNPSAKGTKIAKGAAQNEFPITGIASISNVSLINVVGGGMIGARGMASKIFGALGESNTNVIMISQASSEHSVCIVTRKNDADKAYIHLKERLSHEIENKQISFIEKLEDLEVMAIIGANMRGTPGVSGRLFSSLGAQAINVLAIAQGSSEMNISFVIDNKDTEKALKVIHQAFFHGD